MALRKKQWESYEERALVSNPSRVDAISGATARAQFATLEQLKQKVTTGKIKGSLVPTGTRPSFMEEIKLKGLEISDEIFEPSAAHR